jgi:Protein of unknown function (DUF4242)
MLYTAKCYWPGISADGFDRVAATRLASGSGSGSIVYRGAILFPEDDLVLCLFDASSRAAVKEAAERAGVPCERIIDSVWVPAVDGADLAVGERSRPDDERTQRRNQ